MKHNQQNNQVENDYWDYLATKVQRGRDDIANGRVHTPEDVRNHINKTLLEAVKRYERQVA